MRTMKLPKKGPTMPIAAEREEKNSRMDLRLTRTQRSAYEKAASLKGQTLTQWSVAHLDEAARYDIEQAKLTMLGDKDFELFCQALDEPMPKAAQDLLSREEIWK